MQIRLDYGDKHMDVEVPEGIVVPVSGAAHENVSDPPQALSDALESPLDFPELRLALTPGDHVAVVVDERLPQLPQLLTPLLHHIVSAKVHPDDITLVTSTASKQSWLENIPDVFQDVRVEVHDPDDRNRLSYLATTKEGKRIYLNRTIVDADQSIVLSGCRYDVGNGYGDGARALYPAFSDNETRRQRRRRFSMAAPESESWPNREEAAEVSWLLGAPFYIHVIEGANGGVFDVIAGPLESCQAGRRALDACWRVHAERPAEIVIATLGTDATRHDFPAVANAFANASRVVLSNGYVVVLSQADFASDAHVDMLRRTEEIDALPTLVRQSPHWDMGPIFQWFNAATQAHLMLFSDLPAMMVEDLFAIPLEDVSQLQRLIDVADSCLILDHAHHAFAATG